MEFGEPDGIRFVADLNGVVEISEDPQRRADCLLKDVVNVGEALDGLVQHDECEDKGDERIGCHAVALGLHARQGQQQDDGHGSEDLNDGRGKRLLRHIVEITRFEALGSQAEALGFKVLSTETFHDLMAGDGFLQDLV